MAEDINLNTTGGSSIQNLSPSYLNDQLFQSLSPQIQDTLTRSMTLAELDNLFPNSPSLPAPGISPDVSISDLFKSINSAKLGLTHQLQGSEIVDQQTRRKANKSATLVANFLVDKIEARNAAARAASLSVKPQIDAATNLLNTIQAQVEAQKQLIRNLNTGNAEETTRVTELLNGYNNFVAVLQSLGAVPGLNGEYIIPPGLTPEETQAKIDTYNQAVASYAQTTSEFQTYWTNRVGLYNSATAVYNNNALANNSQITALINMYHLEDVLTPAQLNGLKQSPVATRVPPIFNTLPSPVAITELPAVINSGLPNPGFSLIYQNGPPTLIEPFYNKTSNLISLIKEAILSPIYEVSVAPLDTAINQQVNTWAYLNMLNVFNPPQESAPDPLLNFKPLIIKMLPSAVVDSQAAIETDNKRGGGTLAVMALGLASPHISELLGKSILSQSINNLNLNLNKERLEEVTNQLLVLSAGLLGSNSIQSLVPGLTPLSNLLATLPSNSPAFSLLFSLSFVDQVGQAVQKGYTEEALKSFLERIPELKNIDSAGLANLTAALNLGLLATSTQLLGANLGVNDLTSQVLSAAGFTPSDTIKTQAAQESQQEVNTLQNETKQFFIKQGLPEEDANFLAETAANFTANNVSLSPSATRISTDKINQDVLQRSITSSLILQGYHLNAAQGLTEQVLSQIKEKTYNSSSNFNQNVAEILDSLKVKNSEQIASQTIAIPNSTSTGSLSQQELIELLSTRTQQLLVPQIGTALSKLVTERIAVALFGTPQPDTADLNDVKSVFSLVNVTKIQIIHLKDNLDEQYAETVNNLFKASIPSLHLNVFLEKLMDPANLFVYSLSTGIMYGGHETDKWKRSIDIPV